MSSLTDRAALGGEVGDDREWKLVMSPSGADGEDFHVQAVGPDVGWRDEVPVVPKSELLRVRALGEESEGLREALIFARSELHRAMLERRSTAGYGESFKRINASLSEEKKRRKKRTPYDDAPLVSLAQRLADATHPEAGEITVGERWQHYTGSVYVVKRVYPDDGGLRVTLRSETDGKLSEGWVAYLREHFEPLQDDGETP